MPLHCLQAATQTQQVVPHRHHKANRALILLLLNRATRVQRRAQLYLRHRPQHSGVQCILPRLLLKKLNTAQATGTAPLVPQAVRHFICRLFSKLVPAGISGKREALRSGPRRTLLLESVTLTQNVITGCRMPREVHSATDDDEVGSFTCLRCVRDSYIYASSREIEICAMIIVDENHHKIPVAHKLRIPSSLGRASFEEHKRDGYMLWRNVHRVATRHALKVTGIVLSCIYHTVWDDPCRVAAMTNTLTHRCRGILLHDLAIEPRHRLRAVYSK